MTKIFRKFKGIPYSYPFLSVVILSLKITFSSTQKHHHKKRKMLFYTIHTYKNKARNSLTTQSPSLIKFVFMC